MGHGNFWADALPRLPCPLPSLLFIILRLFVLNVHKAPKQRKTNVFFQKHFENKKGAMDAVFLAWAQRGVAPFASPPPNGSATGLGRTYNQ